MAAACLFVDVLDNHCLAVLLKQLGVWQLAVAPGSCSRLFLGRRQPETHFVRLSSALRHPERHLQVLRLDLLSANRHYAPALMHCLVAAARDPALDVKRQLADARVGISAQCHLDGFDHK